jgi:N utilization substance protein B
MTNMRKMRELAMQVLFLWDANANLDLKLGMQATEYGDVEEGLRVRALSMAERTWSARETIDADMERIAPQWPPRRQPGVDRAILRLAIWELTSSTTPPKVVIDEAIELAKEFSTEQSPGFVNGVLDAVLREKQEPPAKPETRNPGPDGLRALVGEYAPEASAPPDESNPKPE